MSVQRYIALRDEITRLVAERVPGPFAIAEERQDRLCALIDALASELAHVLVQEYAGLTDPQPFDNYLAERIGSLTMQMLGPWTRQWIVDRTLGASNQERTH